MSEMPYIKLNNPNPEKEGQEPDDTTQGNEESAGMNTETE
jgi:hypothetical protein